MIFFKYIKIYLCMLFNNYLGVCFYNIFDTCLIYLTGDTLWNAQ